MPSLNELLTAAKFSQRALGHFNISDLAAFEAIFAAARKLNAPVLVGTSESERAFIGDATAVALVRGVRGATGFPIFLNADHTKSLGKIKAAVDAGFDSVHFDGSALAYEENIAQTRTSVEYAKAKNPDISVEGELGYIATESSKIYEGAIEIRPEQLTNPDQAAEFVARTGVDRLAVAIGNVHGISLAGNPHLDIERLKAVAEKIPKNVGITLHGGSGIPDEEIRAALPHGLSNIHVSTELRVAYEKALAGFLAAHPNETTPYKFLTPAVEAMQKLVEEKLRLFGN